MSEVTEIVKDSIRGLCRQGGEFIKDLGYDALFDGFISTYRQLLQKWAERYLNNEGTDPEILKEHRKKFLKITRMTANAITEVDAYVTGKYHDVWGEVRTLYAPPMKRVKSAREDEHEGN